MKEQNQTLSEILKKIQLELKVGKTHFNKFGGFNYRKTEDIFEALKPILKNILQPVHINCTDEIVLVGTRVYVKATASINLLDTSITACAYAREPELKKGMDESQITGCASSYARKYALAGLFCLDCEEDSDALDNRNVKNNETQPKKTLPINRNIELDIKSLKDCTNLSQLKDLYTELFKIWQIDIKSLKILEHEKNLVKHKLQETNKEVIKNDQ